MAIHDGARPPVNNQSETSAHHAYPPQAQLGSERVPPRQKVTSPSGIAHDRVLDLYVCVHYINYILSQLKINLFHDTCSFHIWKQRNRE